MPKAKARIAWNGGSYASGSYGSEPRPSLRADVIVDDLEIEFEESYCAKHPGQRLEYPSSSCVRCDEHIRTVLKESLDSGFPRIDCAHINHTHECGCYLGHECEPGCKVFDAHASKIDQVAGDDEDEKQRLKKALFGMAADAPNDKLLSVMERIEHLEKENHNLRLVVSKLIDHLPRDVREAVGSAQDLQDP